VFRVTFTQPIDTGKASAQRSDKAVSSTCRVSFTDGADVTHTVTASASSLYEAAAPGITEFKRSAFAFASRAAE
jgi:hypothetical protein